MGGTDEVVFTQSIDRVGRVVDATLTIADGQFRMVVLGMSDPGNGIDEGHGLMKVLELKRSLDAIALLDKLPAAELLQIDLTFSATQW